MVLQSLEGDGIDLQILKRFGREEKYGMDWQSLAQSARVCKCLAEFGMHLKCLERYGIDCQSTNRFGREWKDLAQTLF